MNAQDVILGSRVLHVRELKTQVEKLTAENRRLREENAALRAHFDLALAAAADLGELSGDGRLVIVDGWNLILGADREARNLDELIRQAQAHLGERPQDRVWIVLDGPRPATKVDGRLRITYTGGTGAHRADRFICDFLRMAEWRGEVGRIEVRTRDKDFRKTVGRICGTR